VAPLLRNSDRQRPVDGAAICVPAKPLLALQWLRAIERLFKRERRRPAVVERILPGGSIRESDQPQPVLKDIQLMSSEQPSAQIYLRRASAQRRNAEIDLAHFNKVPRRIVESFIAVLRNLDSAIIYTCKKQPGQFKSSR